MNQPLSKPVCVMFASKDGDFDDALHPFFTEAEAVQYSSDWAKARLTDLLAQLNDAMLGQDLKPGELDNLQEQAEQTADALQRCENATSMREVGIIFDLLNEVLEFFRDELDDEDAYSITIDWNIYAVGEVQP